MKLKEKKERKKEGHRVKILRLRVEFELMASKRLAMGRHQLCPAVADSALDGQGVDKR